MGETSVKIRRSFAAVGLLGLGLVVAVGCQPNPPAPTVRGYRFEIVRGGPFVVGEDDNGDPAALTDTPPEIDVLAAEDGCEPLAVASDLELVKHPYMDESGTVYDAWFLNGGVVQAIVPGDPKCLPDPDGFSYIVAGYADTVANNGPVDGQAGGIALDERTGDTSFTPLFKLVK